MPHLHVTYDKALAQKTDLPGLLSALHAHMVASDVFPTAGIRIRAFAADHAIIADGLAENSFLAMTLSVGTGRDAAVLRSAGDALFGIAQAHLAALLSAPHFALSLEIREARADLSWKDTPIHARLSGPTRG